MEPARLAYDGRLPGGVGDAQGRDDRIYAQVLGVVLLLIGIIGIFTDSLLGLE